MTETILETLGWTVATTPAEEERERRVRDKADMHIQVSPDVDTAVALVAKHWGISKSSVVDIIMQEGLPLVDQIDIGAHLEESGSSRWLWVVTSPPNSFLKNVRAALTQNASLQEGANEDE